GLSQGGCPGRPRAWLALPEREGDGRQLAHGALVAIILCEYLRPLDHGPADLGPDGRVQVLSQAGARGPGPVPKPGTWVRLSDRNEREGMAQRDHPEGNPDRVRRPHAVAKHAEPGDP